MTTTLKRILAEFKRLDLNEGDGMALLAQSNTISDECVRVWDIAAKDQVAALIWLRRQPVSKP